MPDTNPREYHYGGVEDPHTAGYLWPSVLSLLPAAPARVCEIGCGNGAFAERLRRLGHEVVAFDPSTSGIERARSRSIGVRFEVGAASDQPLPELAGSFDAVVSLEVIEHLPLPRELARCASSLLKPGGRLILSTPYHGYLKNVLLALTGRMDAHFGALWDHGHVKFFSRKTLGLLLREEGFQDVEMRGSGRVPLLWMSLVASCRKPAAP